VNLLLTRALRRLGLARSWALPAFIITAVFFTSWPLMVLAEPASNAITEPENYWWYFVVTASTVGYGDYFPVSSAGHLVGAYVIVGGIVTLTTLFTRIAVMLENAKGRRMKGQLDVDMSGHLVIIGYAPGRTERLIDEYTAEGRSQVVLCAWDDVPQNPMPERDEVEFVRGNLAHEDVLRRAGVQRAGRVLVDARDDNEALSLTVAAMHVNPDVHAVVTLRDMSTARNLSYVDPDVRCVQWHSPQLVTEELEDPGISQVYADLMTSGGRNTYSVPLPETLGEVSFGHVQERLGRDHTATVIAVRCDGAIIHPRWDTTLPGKSILYYVGERRLTTAEVARAVG
jgi:voltage-gated potassium channel